MGMKRQTLCTKHQQCTEQQPQLADFDVKFQNDEFVLPNLVMQKTTSLILKTRRLVVQDNATARD